MNILVATLAFAAAQSAPVDHSQHTPAQHAQHQQGQQQGEHAQHQQGQHQGEHKCCREVNGKMECQMMKGHGGHQSQGQHQDHSGQ